MPSDQKTQEELLRELAELQRRLEEADATLEAIRSGTVDALVVATPQGEQQLFTLDGADRVYRVFLESISQGAVTLSGDGMILYANAAAGRLLSPDRSLAGTLLRTFVRRNERARFDALFLAGKRAAVSAEIRLRGQTGGRPMNLSLHPLEDRGDAMIVAVLTDLSDQKKSAEMLEADRLARSILERTGESIVVCDESAVIVRASRSVAKLVGQNPLFQDFDSILPLHTADGRRFSLKKRSRLKPSHGQEVTFSRGDGTSFSLILNADPLRTGELGLLGTVVTLTDVTRLKQAEEAREHLLHDLEHANRELAVIESLARTGLRLANLDQLIHSIVSQVAKALDADQAMLLLVTDGHLASAASVPPLPPGKQFSMRVGSGFAGTVAKMRRSLYVEDAKSSRLVKRRGLGRGVTSLLGAPLLFNNEVLGVVHVGWLERHSVQPREQGFLEVMAQRAAEAISARMLTEEVEKQRAMAEQLARKLGSTNGELTRINQAEREARRQVRQELERTRLLQDVTTAATSSLSLREISQKVLREMSRRIDPATAAIFAMDESAGTLLGLAFDGYPKDVASELRLLPIDEGSVAGYLLLHDHQQLSHCSDNLPKPSKERLRPIVAEDRRWIALPIRRRDRPLGVLVLTFEGKRCFAEDELSLYRSMAELLGGAFENARSYEAELAAQKHAQQELDTSQTLLKAANELNRWTDVNDVLGRLAHAVLGSTRHARVFVTVLANDRSQVTVVTSAGDRSIAPGTVFPWEELSSVLQAALTDGKTRIVDFGQLPEEERRHADPAGFRVALLAPLVYAGRVLGHIAIDDPFARSEFTDREVEIVEGIAAQAAVAIENARLFEAQRRIALTLQENFIHTLPVVEGVDLGAVSHPASQPELVGGDFSDVFALDEHHVVVLIGDVSGKGVRAAGMTETVRSTARALALIDPSPAFILEKANQLLLHREREEAHVTAFCALLDPTTGHASYASAGHPPPVHLAASSCQFLPATFGPPLGSWQFPYANQHTTLTLDDCLVFYTDGITEARREGEFFGEERLLKTVSGLRDKTAQEIADAVRDAAVSFGETLRDDVEVVSVRLA